MNRRIEFEQWLPAPLERVFLFFADPRNLPRIMPPATGTMIIASRLIPPPPKNPDNGAAVAPLAGAGSEIVTSFRLFPYLPIRAKWIARIAEFEWDHHFADTQVKGPFKRFHHRHEFAAETREEVCGTSIRDVVDYEVGYGPLGAIAAPLLKQTFAWRQRAVEEIFAGL